jgi:magnesium-transporting ATPase (P-type)
MVNISLLWPGFVHTKTGADMAHAERIDNHRRSHAECVDLADTDSVAVPSIPLSRLLSAIHANPVSEVYDRLATCPFELSTSEAGERLARYGPNVIRDVKGRPLVVNVLANFTHLMAILLWVGWWRLSHGCLSSVLRSGLSI